ncbi:hypothetical protein AMTR_s00061p00086800 [Amborella trichopoda]|uniref:Uncharacterized protein n=1 Tax=Amborella trichopoda TaxID=13333 RepID=U5DF76_AMBTC|nr:hypothetical protein AMTR_s00061p00086800 [Amborella trichopoda]
MEMNKTYPIWEKSSVHNYRTIGILWCWMMCGKTCTLYFLIYITEVDSSSQLVWQPMHVLSKVYLLGSLDPLLQQGMHFGGRKIITYVLRSWRMSRSDIVKECDGLPLAMGSVMWRTPKTVHNWDKAYRSLAI